MRVQQQGQSLRLRINEAELARLLAGETVQNETCWPDGQVERQQLVLAEHDDWHRHETGWRMALADADARDLALRLPSRDGLQRELPVPGGSTLCVLFDVDVRDSVRQRRSSKGSN